MARKTRTTPDAADRVTAPAPVTETMQDTPETGIIPAGINTSAEDNPEGGAPERVEADRGMEVPAAQPEVAAPDATSAPDTGRPSTVGGDAGATGLAQHPAAEGSAPAAIPQPDADRPLSATPETGVDAGGGLGDVAAVVICLVEGGRRRAGRRWAQGETNVRDGELDAIQLAQLQGDPQFRVHVRPGTEG